jgi:hypothetical protein
MQNIQKKFTIVDRNNEDPIFDDEKQNISNMNLNINLNCSGKGIKTPNQIIKNICKEIDNRSNMDMQNKIYSMLSFIKNNLFIKIELKENETIELDNKIKQLLKINKDIKDNILSNENNIFLKKYNLLNSLFNENQEKIQILEIEYLTLIKDFCNYIQNGEKIIIKVEKIFRKYNNNKINNDSMNNEQYELEQQSNESDLLSSIEKGKGDEIIHFLSQNEKNKNNENKNDNNNDLINKYKQEIEILKKYINEMKIRLMTISNNLNKLSKDKYINDNYNDLFLSLFKLLNYSDEQIT